MSQFEWLAETPISIQIDQCVLEAVCYGPSPQVTPVIVLLHEGLGCVALWRDFPRRLSIATGCGVFVYSRAGYGLSDPVTLPRPLDYMTREATSVLPEVLDSIGAEKTLLLGHSDGASIAAIYPGEIADHRIRGLVLIAPHFFTEAMQLTAIAEAKVQYQNSTLKSALSKYHKNVDNAFYGWNDVWLDPEFRSWNISDSIEYWRIPVLALQGVDDQYGTIAQLDVMLHRSYCPVEIELIDDCEHSPHAQQTDITVNLISGFVGRLLEAELVSVV